MFVHNINPALMAIGPLEIRYYSLAYVIGAIFTYFMLQKLAKERHIGLSKEDILDFVAYMLLSIVIFSRLFYILIYNLPYYLNNPLEMLAVWHGGLSFHGGLFGAVVFALVYCKKKKLNFWKLADMTVIPVAVCLFLGRIGNFINGEVYGRIASVPWAVKFKDAEGYRHPSQLYEAAKNLFMFIVLYSIRNKKLKDGVLFWIFIVMYGSLRFFIEFFREPDGILFLGLSTGQGLSLLMLLIGIPSLFWFWKRK